MLPSGIEISAFDFALKKVFIDESLAVLDKSRPPAKAESRGAVSDRCAANSKIPGSGW
jgi:hypothetical protein